MRIKSKSLNQKQIVEMRKPKEVNQNIQSTSHEKSILSRVAHIITEDIKEFLHIDNKTREDKMRYEMFMEMFKE